MKHLFIFNPRALPEGKTRDNLLAKIEEKCSGLDYEIYFSVSGKDAEDKARASCLENDEICIYAGGGDGTIRQMAQAIYGFDNAILSTIPLGTGNDFVRNFGGRDAFMKLEHITDGQVHQIDLIKANDYICINVLNIGFDESVVTRVDKLRGPFMNHSLAYTLGVVFEFFKFPKEQLCITYPDGSQFTDPFVLTYVANGKYYGGGFCAASEAVLDDGLADIMTIYPLPRTSFLRLIGDYKKGTLLGKEKYRHMYRFHKGNNIRMEKDTPFRVSMDGEIFSVDALDIQVLHKAIRFKAPKEELL